jgi:3-deoxy-7-phosphoheptulonate synthase
MLESSLEPGTQPLTADVSKLRYGCSITDPCLGWDATADALREVRAALAGVVAERRGTAERG